MASAIPPRLAQALGSLCIPQLCLIPNIGCPRSNTRRWCEVNGAGVFTQHGLGHAPRWLQETQQPLDLSALPGVKPACMCSSGAEFRLLTAPLLVPVVLQPAKGALLPCIGPQDWGAQSGSHFSLPRAGVCPRILPVPLGPSQGQRSQPNCFSFLHTWLHVYLSYSLGCIGVLCQLVVFSENCSTYRCIFDVFMSGGECHILLLHHFDWSPTDLFLIT